MTQTADNGTGGSPRRGETIASTGPLPGPARPADGPETVSLRRADIRRAEQQRTTDGRSGATDGPDTVSLRRADIRRAEQEAAKKGGTTAPGTSEIDLGTAGGSGSAGGGKGPVESPFGRWRRLPLKAVLVGVVVAAVAVPTLLKVTGTDSVVLGLRDDDRPRDSRSDSAEPTDPSVIGDPATGTKTGPGSVIGGAVATTGPDGRTTTRSAPFGTIRKAFETLRPGDTLVIGDGVYTEKLDDVKNARGTASAPITVKAAPGARPVVEGLLWFHDADYWHVSGLNVRWDDSDGKGPHMMKFAGGTGWSYTDAEISGARAYAAILLSDNTSAFRLANLYIHDTADTHGTNQDHLIYANADTSGGVIERCILANSPNGRAIKIGVPDGSSDVTGNLTIRYNTMYNNLGPSNVQLSYNARNVKIYRNIMVKPSSGTENVTGFNLEGSGNVVYDNLVYQSAGAAQKTDGLKDGGGNVVANPGFVNAGGGNFRTNAAKAKAYGRYGG
ncbi:hypothetical protein [Kineosporia sp. A_224]|uniref:hypothetical protein n=1 Tax=Kineosporia sp. A_224 TaxID=1962180 RepID=UPI000B4BF6D6|nr:hypothetical protein [Kineosporia sp. A_224]